MGISSKTFILLVVISYHLASVTARCSTSRRNIPQLKDVQDAMKCSRNIYDDPNRVGSIIAGTRFRVKMLHKSRRGRDEFKVFVAEHGYVTIVAFRGTATTGQLLRQFVTQLANMKGKHYNFAGVNMRINAFFLDAFNSLFGRLKPYLRDARRKYILTGHSLGGALASILALKMTREYRGSIWRHPQSSLITFGQPRVGDQKYADLHDRLISPWRKYRFVLHKDPVPKIPFRPFVHHSGEIFMSFFYHKTCFWCRRKKTYFWRVCRGQEDGSCSRKYNINIFTLTSNVRDHMPPAYQKKILNPPNVFINTHNQQKRSFEESLSTSCR